MKQFFTHHRPHLFVLLFIFLIAGVSWYVGFVSPNHLPTRPPVAASLKTGSDHSPVRPELVGEGGTTTPLVQANVGPQPTPGPVRKNEGFVYNSVDKDLTKNEEQIQESSKTIPVTLITASNTYQSSTTVSEGSTVFDFMQQLVKESNFTFSGKEFGGNLGFFVEEINGVKNGDTKNHYWVYSINGEKAKLGISNYALKPNDIISWTYETAQ